MRYLSPPAIARRYGVSPDKVLAWIRAGELEAVNIATRQGGRPRYVVSPEALAAFEARRSAATPPTTTRTPRRRRVEEVIEFF